MYETRVHPRIEARIEANRTTGKRRIETCQSSCIDKLESAIETLSVLRGAHESEVVDLLFEVYDWALGELKIVDVGAPSGAEHIAAVGRLLKRCTQTDPQDESAMVHKPF